MLIVPCSQVVLRIKARDHDDSIRKPQRRRVRWNRRHIIQVQVLPDSSAPHCGRTRPSGITIFILASRALHDSDWRRLRAVSPQQCALVWHKMKQQLMTSCIALRLRKRRLLLRRVEQRAIFFVVCNAARAVAGYSVGGSRSLIQCLFRTDPSLVPYVRVIESTCLLSSSAPGGRSTSLTRGRNM